MKTIFKFKNIAILLAIASLGMADDQLLAQAPKTLKIAALKYEIAIPFTDSTTIAQVKQAINAKEGMPADHLRLTKSEGWALGLPPKKIITVLQDGQTCASYDLQPNQTINASLTMPKSQAKIAAELKARKDTLFASALPESLPKELIEIVGAYDDYNKD